MRPLLFIGDVHGKSHQYIGVCATAQINGQNTLQIGDLGFSDTYEKIMDSGLSIDTNRMFKGNHDGYNYTPRDFPYDIGDFGQVPGYPEIFFVRGGFSIDRKFRTAGHNWFDSEELTYSQFAEAMALYRKLKPRVLVSHEPPFEFGQHIGNPSMLRAFGFDPDTFKTVTATFLQMMIDEHPPELVVCGHFHLDCEMVINETKFVCLSELGTYLYEPNEAPILHPERSDAT